MSGPVPQWLLTPVVALTVFCVMFGIGLGLGPGDLRRAWRSPGPVLRGLLAVLVAVPVLAVIIVRALGLPEVAQAGIVLMAMSPGAPVALRRSLEASGSGAFAPGLQICIALLAVLSMPLSIAVLNRLYGAHASVLPAQVMSQVFVAQLLPLGLGIAFRRAFAALATRVEPHVARAGTVLLLATVAVGLVILGEATLRAGLPVLAASALVTAAALGAGHLLGGPAPATRTAVAIISAARNPGLALLVATLNAAPPQVTATILAYLVVSAIVITPYALWRHRTGALAR
jgi:BASS family bile acid:Na+ symporter